MRSARGDDRARRHQVGRVWLYHPRRPLTTRRFDSTLGYPGEGPVTPWTLLDNLSSRIHPTSTDWSSVEFSPSGPVPHYSPNPDWIGHNMANKPPSTGLRIIHINIQQKGATREDDTMFLEKILQYATEMQGDIITLQEPGRITPKLGSLFKSIAEKYKYQALILTGNNTAKKGEGVVVLLSQPWQQVFTSSAEWPNTVPARTYSDNSRGSQARIAQLNFKAARREPAPPPTPGTTYKPPPPKPTCPICGIRLLRSTKY